jgi:peroxiredoxin
LGDCSRSGGACALPEQGLLPRFLVHAAIVFAVFFPTLVSAAAGELRPWTGAALPPFELKDMDGRVHRLQDYRGKVVLVNFWATWCEPCRAEMPSMQQLRRKMESKGFVVLGINADEPPPRIRKFLGELPLDFPVLMDPDLRVTKSWAAKVLPASYLIGRDGQARYQVIGELDWLQPATVKTIAALTDAK